MASSDYPGANSFAVFTFHRGLLSVSTISTMVKLALRRISSSFVNSNLHNGIRFVLILKLANVAVVLIQNWLIVGTNLPKLLNSHFIVYIF